jgi:hypothetical protein
MVAGTRTLSVSRLRTKWLWTLPRAEGMAILRREGVRSGRPSSPLGGRHRLPASLEIREIKSEEISF